MGEIRSNLQACVQYSGTRHEKKRSRREFDGVCRSVSEYRAILQKKIYIWQNTLEKVAAFEKKLLFSVIYSDSGT